MPGGVIGRAAENWRHCTRPREWWLCILVGAVFVGVSLLLPAGTNKYITASFFALGCFWLFLAVVGRVLGIFDEDGDPQERRARARRIAKPFLVVLMATCVAVYAAVFGL